MPSRYRLRRRVQFAETDMAGMVHFSWYCRYMEEAEHALWRSAGLSVAPPGATVGWPRVAVSCEFRRPLRFEDEFDIDVRVADMTEKTIRFACEMTRDGEPIASGSLTVVCVRQQADGAMEAIRIPDEVRRNLGVAADVA